MYTILNYLASFQLNKQLTYLLVLLCCFSLNDLQAQAPQKQDVVYLNNGSVIKGKLESLPEEPNKVRIKSAGNLWVFDMEEVKSIEHGKLTTPDQPANNFFNEVYFKRQEAGFYNVTDIGLMYGKDANNYNAYSFSFHIINGYQINKKWSSGIGIGIESMDRGFLPVFVEGKYHLWDQDFSPYAAMQVGYGFPMERMRQGGILLNPQIGFRSYTNHKNGVNFSLGYRFQKSSYDGVYYNDFGNEIGSIKQTTYYHRFVVRFGFLFN